MRETTEGTVLVARSGSGDLRAVGFEELGLRSGVAEEDVVRGGVGAGR